MIEGIRDPRIALMKATKAVRKEMRSLGVVPVVLSAAIRKIVPDRCAPENYPQTHNKVIEVSK